MAASLEWTDWHLSPAGWVSGDQKRDNGTQPRAAPGDRALTTRYIEECNGYGAVYGRHQDVWRSPDHRHVELLLMEFGAAPSEL